MITLVGMTSHPKKNSVSLLSGGLDSTVAAYMAHGLEHPLILCLTFDYGQRAVSEEIQRSKQIADSLAVPHKVIKLPWLKELCRTNALTDRNKSLPQPSREDLDNTTYGQASAKQVWVPNRNGVFIAIASAIAEAYGANYVVTGFNVEEAATFPDNSQAYLAAITHSLAYSTENQVRVISPTAALTKTQIVQKALALKAPLDKIWSCYETGEKMCGKCESCMRLKRALSQNEVSCDEHFASSAL